jgi:hypothetical protein
MDRSASRDPPRAASGHPQPCPQPQYIDLCIPYGRATWPSRPGRDADDRRKRSDRPRGIPPTHLPPQLPHSTTSAATHGPTAHLQGRNGAQRSRSGEGLRASGHRVRGLGAAAHLQIGPTWTVWTPRGAGSVSRRLERRETQGSRRKLVPPLEAASGSYQQRATRGAQCVIYDAICTCACAPRDGDACRPNLYRQTRSWARARSCQR